MNNSTANLLSISCLNWGVQPNYGAALYALCPATSAINDNGTLQSATFKAGGSGYPQFLVMNESFNYDALNRLTSASDSGGWSRTFNYDQAGNMWVTNPVGGRGRAARRPRTPSPTTASTGQAMTYRATSWW